MGARPEEPDIIDVLSWSGILLDSHNCILSRADTPHYMKTRRNGQEKALTANAYEAGILDPSDTALSLEYSILSF